MILWLMPIGFVLLTMVLIRHKSRRSLIQTDDSEFTDEQQQELDSLIAKIEQGGER